MPGSEPKSTSPTPLPTKRFRDWILTPLSQNSQLDTWQSVAAVVLLVAIIGIFDYLTGVRVSLALFYVLPVTLAVLWLGWRAGCLTGLASVLIRVIGDEAAGGYTAGVLTVFWNRLIDLSMYCVLAGILHALITLQRQLEQRVKERTEALARSLNEREELQRQLFNISRRERASIGHELHDGLGQHLTATSLAVKLLGNRLEAEAHPSAPEARTLLRLIQEGIVQSRQIARGLLLSSIDPEQLTGELEELCTKLQHEQNVVCQFSMQGPPLQGIDVGVASHLYYIAQEAARNAIRHGRPTRIEVSLRHDPGQLVLAITDNGKGLPTPPPSNGGMGLRIMAHRAQLIGASFSVEPGSDGNGLRIRATLPLGNISKLA